MEKGRIEFENESERALSHWEMGSTTCPLCLRGESCADNTRIIQHRNTKLEQALEIAREALDLTADGHEAGFYKLSQGAAKAINNALSKIDAVMKRRDEQNS